MAKEFEPVIVSPSEVRPGGKANKVLSTLIIYVTEPVEVSLTPR
jgi:hypothetical protein